MFTFRARRSRLNRTRRTSVQFQPGVDELAARIAPSSGLGVDAPPPTQDDYMVEYYYPETEVVATSHPLFCPLLEI